MNELRAISELPLGKIYDLNDKSETGKKIWDLLQTSERTRDVSLLEEAGRLLWEQVTRRPYSMVPSDAKESLGDQPALLDAVQDMTLGTACGGYLQDGDMNKESRHGLLAQDWMPAPPAANNRRTGMRRFKMSITGG